jgi:hypothetical protein
VPQVTRVILVNLDPRDPQVIRVKLDTRVILVTLVTLVRPDKPQIRGLPVIPVTQDPLDKQDLLDKLEPLDILVIPVIPVIPVQQGRPLTLVRLDIQVGQVIPVRLE